MKIDNGTSETGRLLIAELVWRLRAGQEDQRRVNAALQNKMLADKLMVRAIV